MGRFGRWRGGQGDEVGNNGAAAVLCSGEESRRRQGFSVREKEGAGRGKGVFIGGGVLGGGGRGIVRSLEDRDLVGGWVLLLNLGDVGFVEVGMATVPSSGGRLL